MVEPTIADLRVATRNAVRDILLGDEGQLLLTRVAEQAATRAITDFMLKIGMDTTTPQAILSLQDDMRFLRRWNAITSSGMTKFILTVVSLAATGGWAMLIFGARHYLTTP